MPTLDQLMNKLGLTLWQRIANQIVLPLFSLVGVLACSISFGIFLNKRKFADPIFVYYRLLTFLYIAALLVNFPLVLCYTPTHFLSLDTNTYACGIFFIPYGFLNALFFHYCSVFEILILVTRMKIFSPFLRTHFTATPLRVSLSLFAACLIIDLPVFFSISVGSLG